MQQVKKQLQDAIKKLKSYWGINEVKREDLAAVLDKVVAAVERADQLPVAPAKTEFEGSVITVVKKYSDEESFSVEDGNAPLGSIPALYGPRGSHNPQILMYNRFSRKMYRYTNNGNTVKEEYKNHVFLCEGSFIMFPRNSEGVVLSEIRIMGTNVYSH